MSYLLTLKKFSRGLSQNVHLPFDKLTTPNKVEGLRCTHPSSLQRTTQVRFIPQDCLQAGVGDSVLLVAKHFSTASIQEVFRQASRLFVVKIFFLVSFSMVKPGWTIELQEYTEAASIMAFADNLFQHGHYYRAIMEYERFSYFHSKHPDIPKARFNIARSMKSAGNYASALELFTSLAKEYKGIDLGIEASFHKADVLFLMHEYQSALNQYAEFILHYPQHQLIEKARNAIKKIEKQSSLSPQRMQR